MSGVFGVVAPAAHADIVSTIKATVLGIPAFIFAKIDTTDPRCTFLNVTLFGHTIGTGTNPICIP